MNNQMPNKGSSLFTPFTGVLPEGKSEIVNAGIPLFECVCLGAPTGTQIFGFHDVDVRIRRQDRGQTFGLDYDVRWHRGMGGERNYIRYEWDKKTERSYVFIPDDPVWHNRMMLAETITSGKFAISRYITLDGILSGEAMTERIKFISECIFDHSVVSKGKVLFRSKNLDEALRKEMELTGAGTPCQTVHSKIEAIEDMIRKYGVTWKAHPDFVNGIRKDIEDQIAQRFTTEVQPERFSPDPKELIREAFSPMTPQERLQLFQDAMNPSMSPPVNPAQRDAKVQPEVKKRPIDIDLLGNDSLNSLCEEFGIFTKGMQRADKVKAVKEAMIKKDGGDPEAKVLDTTKGEEFK